jgi:hypothetical protein
MCGSTLIAKPFCYNYYVPLSSNARIMLLYILLLIADRLITSKNVLLSVGVALSLVLAGYSVALQSEFASAVKPVSSVGLLPDLQTAVPQHIQIQNEHQRELLRLSNGVANTGDGPWHMRPVIPLDDPTEPQAAIQDVLDANGNVVESKLVSQFEFHPTHNHWHIAGVGVFEVRAESPTGPLVGDSVKKTACLIDWYKINDNSKTPERVYWDCAGASQGITVGWVDQYHHSLDDQEVDITGAPPGRYYLVSTANPERIFLEKDYSNNAAWVAFDLTRDSNGNAKIEIVGNSPCEAGLCGDNSANR